MLLSRGGRAIAVLAALSVVLIAPDAGPAARAVAGPDFPQSLLALASLVQLVVASWVLLILAVAQLGSTSRLARAMTPELIRRALFAGAAGALALSPVQADRATSPSHPSEHSLDGLQLPDRPVTITTDQESESDHRTVVVKHGDTLWGIAARSLPHHASAAQIAEACAAWYAANQTVIGGDPDMIHPLQRLTPPPPKDVP